jgi:hypothetical protein
MTPRIAPESLLPLSTGILLATVLATALSGCTPGSPTSSPSPGQSADGTAPSVSAAPVATGPKACELVTAAMIQAAYGYDPGTGTEKGGFGGAGSTECDYDGTGKTIVQVSLQADTYFPAATYDKSQVEGAADPDAASGAERGYIAPEAVLVVKGGVGVFVTTVQKVGIPAGQTLAKAIVAGM